MKNDFKKIAFIGTGVMGSKMVLHLANNGYNVYAYNRTFEKAKALEPSIIASKSIIEAIKDADVVFSIVGYPSDVEEIYQTIIPSAKKGSILVDMTTSSPKLAKRLAITADSYGLRMLDAPVTGGDFGALNASLAIMVGGNINAYNKVLPLLKLLGTNIVYMGESGSGQHTKLANQIAIAGSLFGAGESLSYAQKHHLDLNKVLHILTTGSAASWQIINNGPKMISADYQPGFYLKHFLKDLNIAIEELDNLEFPVLKTAQEICQVLSEFNKNLGTQTIIKFYNEKLK